MSNSKIEDLIPHRKPFLFVEDLLNYDDDKIQGTVKFGGERDFFRGHFPEYPVVPGVILVEAMAQCGGAGLRANNSLDPSCLFFLASLEKAKFRNQVRPNDTIRIEVKNILIAKKMIKQSGKAYIDKLLVAEATWMCVVASKDSIV